MKLIATERIKIGQLVSLIESTMEIRLSKPEDCKIPGTVIGVAARNIEKDVQVNYEINKNTVDILTHIYNHLSVHNTIPMFNFSKSWQARFESKAIN